MHLGGCARHQRADRDRRRQVSGRRDAWRCSHPRRHRAADSAGSRDALLGAWAEAAAEVARRARGALRCRLVGRPRALRPRLPQAGQRPVAQRHMQHRPQHREASGGARRCRCRGARRIRGVVQAERGGASGKAEALPRRLLAAYAQHLPRQDGERGGGAPARGAR